MTKNKLWIKLIVVALIIATISAFFIGCNNNTDEEDKKDPCTSHVDANKDGKCDNCGATVTPPEEPVDTEGVDALLAMVDDAIKELASINNVGSLGADAFVEVEVGVEGKTDPVKVRVDLDLSLDLLKDSGTNYENNGFGFKVAVNDKDYFGVWFIDGEEFLYLQIDQKQFKIDALTLSKVLAKYNVNANVPEDTLDTVSVAALAGSYAEMIAEVLAPTYDKATNTVTLNLNNLFKPAEGDDMNMAATMLDAILFGADSTIKLENILADNFGVKINSTTDLYNILPPINVTFTGNYEGEQFKSISLGVDVDGAKIEIPTIDGDPILVCEDFSDVDVKATLGFDILNNDDNSAIDNVANSMPADRDSWYNMGLINVALESDLKLGVGANATADKATTYKLKVAANINPALLADAAFTVPANIKNSDGSLVKNEDGSIKVVNAINLGSISGATGMDLITALLASVDSLYISLQGKDANDLFVVNLNKAFTINEKTGKLNSDGQLYIQTAGLKTLINTFAPDADLSILDSIKPGVVEGTFISSLLPTIGNMAYKALYKLEDGQTLVAASAAATVAESSENTEEAPKFDFNAILDTVKKVIANSVKLDETNKTLTLTADADDKYVIDGATLTGKIVGSYNEDKSISVVTEEAIKLTTADNFVTAISIPTLKIGGTNNLFSTEVQVNQTTAKGESHFAIFVGLNLIKVGYGCAPTSPIKVDANGNNVTDIFTTNGFVLENNVTSWWTPAN